MVMITLVMLLCLAMPVGWCQVDNSKPIVGGPFYLDSNADCNGPARELYGQTTQVVGHGAIQEAQSPTSCTLTLKSTSNFDKTNLHIEVVASVIRDCYVRLTIFDGDPGQGTLKAYDCNTQAKPNERDLVTTGDTVSFTLERRDSTNMLYDIEIFVTPIVSGNRPGYENDWGQDFGFFREKLQGAEACAIVAAAFAITLFVCVVLFICCYRKYKGSNKPWETHQLSSFRPPPSMSMYETKSKMSDTSSGVWASNVSRGAAQPTYSRRPVPPQSRIARGSEDDESVFSDDMPPKQKLQERERQMELERQRQEMEQERNRGRGRNDRGFATHNDSYVQADDDHPQDTFVERIIEPRVRPSRVHKPPSYSEAVNESETEKSELDEEEEEDDVDNKESSEEEEEESEEAESEEEPAVAPKPAPRPKNQPPAAPSAVPMQPGMQLPGMQPRQPFPGYPGMPYMGAYPMQPGQFIPVMAGPNQFRPVAPGPGYPPPRYPGAQPQPAQQIRPTDPPIYSYLVQRGYTPMEGRQSPVSSANTSHSNAGHISDDPDADLLASGVEYMRR